MEKKLCPSAPFKEGNKIFALFDDQHFKFTDQLKMIDGELTREVVEDGDRAAYRATMPCVTKGCGNWDGQKCTVPDQMRYYLSPLTDIEDFRNCPIQKGCRWFAQEGESACRICPLIKTRVFEPEASVP